MAQQENGTGAGGDPRQPGSFEQDVRNAASRVEEELQRMVRYINDEVVPDVRRHSSTALRTAADGLRAMAEKMDDRRP